MHAMVAMIAVAMVAVALATTRNHQLHTCECNKSWPNNVYSLAREVAKVVQKQDNTNTENQEGDNEVMRASASSALFSVHEELLSITDFNLDGLPK